MRNFLITVIFLLIVGGVGLAVYKLQGLKQIEMEQESSMRVGIKNNSQRGELFEGALGAYTLRLREDFEIEDQGEYSYLFYPETDELGVGPTNLMYISIAPQGMRDDQSGIYNYNPEDFTKLIRTLVGDTVVLGDEEDEALEEYFRYERLADQMVGGYGAKVFQNTQPWEFPAGTVEYRYIVETEPVHYIIGAYLGDDESSGYFISQAQFEEILATLKLTPDAVKLAIPEEASTEWVTFSDTAAGLSFDYPADWQKNTGGQNFESGDLLNLTVVGQTQRPQTELYDGASIAVMNPINTTVEVSTWVRDRYADQGHSEAGNPPEFSQVSYGGVLYERAYVCGLGCFEYFHTKQNGRVYGFMLYAAGPQEAQHRETFRQLMESVEFE